MDWFSLELRRPDPRSGCELPHTMLSRSSRPDAASSVSFRDNRPFCEAFTAYLVLVLREVDDFVAMAAGAGTALGK